MAARRFPAWPVAALAALSAAGAHAEDPAAAPPCEFHVWTSQGLSMAGQGPGVGGSPILPTGTMGSLSGDYVGRDDISAFMPADPGDPSSPLSPERQLEVLPGLQLAETFGLNGYLVTFHKDPVASVALRGKNARLTASTSPCYAELVLQDVTYSLEYGRDDKLRTLFFFRKFGPGNEIERRFSTFTQQKLEITPRKKKSYEKTAWYAAIKDAFVKNLAEFAASLHK